MREVLFTLADGLATSHKAIKETNLYKELKRYKSNNFSYVVTPENIEISAHATYTEPPPPKPGPSLSTNSISVPNGAMTGYYFSGPHNYFIKLKLILNAWNEVLNIRIVRNVNNPNTINTVGSHSFTITNDGQSNYSLEDGGDLLHNVLFVDKDYILYDGKVYNINSSPTAFNESMFGDSITVLDFVEIKERFEAIVREG